MKFRVTPVKMVLTLMVALVLPVFVIQSSAQKTVSGRNADFQRYESYFERNDSGLTGATSYLAFTSKAEFDKIFGPAATMGKNSFLPDNVFDTKIVVAAIGRGRFIRTYDVTKVTAKNKKLYVWFDIKDGRKSDSASFKSPMILAFDKGDYSQVVFIQNGKSVGSASLSPSATKRTDDVFGYFFIAGKAPATFRNIDHLNLEGKYGRDQHPASYGRIRLKNKARTDYILRNATVDDKNLSFITRTVRGVSYEFTGTLTTTDFHSEPRSDEIVLTGTLKKMQAGKIVAEEKVAFTWSNGG